MTELVHHNRTQQLIQDIEKKDRRFRLAQSIFTMIILIVLIGIVSAQYRTLSGVQTQLTQAKVIAKEDSNESESRQSTIIRHLDCMVVYFSQKDRTNLTIQNIDKCTLNRDGNIQQFFTQESGEDPETTNTVQPSTEV